MHPPFKGNIYIYLELDYTGLRIRLLLYYYYRPGFSNHTRSMVDVQHSYQVSCKGTAVQSSSQCCDHTWKIARVRLLLLL